MSVPAKLQLSSDFNSFVKRLQNHAQIPLVRSVDNSIRLSSYINNAKQMIIQANTYRREGNLAAQYVMLFRFANLFVNVIQKHNNANGIEYRRDIFELKKICIDAMNQIEALEKQLQAKYEKDMMMMMTMQNQQQQQQQQQQQHHQQQQQPSAPPPLLYSMMPHHHHHQNQEKNAASQLYHSFFDEPTSGPQLRTVVINRRLVDEFLSYAHPALAKNIEFCGILAGILNNNELHITHLILPQQTGTPDSCQALNEIDIFEYQNKWNLLTLGWIHTHPTQQAFLSSVDLKTHYGYQMMLPEAVAIVCAPKANPNLGVFRIIDDGLMMLGDWMKMNPRVGTNAHESFDIVLFEPCKHVKLSSEDSIPFEVVDLRRHRTQ